MIRDILKTGGYMSEVLTFLDVTHLIAKANLWEERDKAIKEKVASLNSTILPSVAYDKQARIGYKSKDKYWYG